MRWMSRRLVNRQAKRGTWIGVQALPASMSALFMEIEKPPRGGFLFVQQNIAGTSGIRQLSAHIHRHHCATHLYCTVVHSDALSLFFDPAPNLQL